MTSAKAAIWTSMALLAMQGSLRAADPAPSYAKDIKPLLTKYCTECHGAKQAKAGVRLESVADIMKGGKKGTLLVVGKPEQSLLVRTMTGQAKQMPPKSYANKPTAAEIDKIKAWIAAGAKDDTKAACLDMPLGDTPPELASNPALWLLALLKEGAASPH
jgi:mono/diheme cytochrome c family protein